HRGRRVLGPGPVRPRLRPYQADVLVRLEHKGPPSPLPRHQPLVRQFLHGPVHRAGADAQGPVQVQRGWKLRADGVFDADLTLQEFLDLGVLWVLAQWAAPFSTGWRGPGVRPETPGSLCTAFASI